MEKIFLYDKVKVKLNDFGRQIINGKFEEYKRLMSLNDPIEDETLNNFFETPVDSEGYTDYEQIWELFNLFGPKIYSVDKLPFDGDMIITRNSDDSSFSLDPHFDITVSLLQPGINRIKFLNEINQFYYLRSLPYSSIQAGANYVNDDEINSQYSASFTEIMMLFGEQLNPGLELPFSEKIIIGKAVPEEDMPSYLRN